ncbi:MAG TPA: hypothetical protein VI524_01665, partial [Anaerolineales bacterium]|nr:hypothetical protein [Anaerolineales bacterium]
AMLEQLKGSMNQSNGEMFSALASPIHGVNVHLWAYDSAVNITQGTARSIFTSTQTYDWGSGAKGQPEIGTFKDVMQPRFLDALNAPDLERYCDELTNVFPLSRPWPYPTVRFYNLRKPGTPGIELDFRTLLIGVEYINNQPYLYAIVNIVWEP